MSAPPQTPTRTRRARGQAAAQTPQVAAPQLYTAADLAQMPPPPPLQPAQADQQAQAAPQPAVPHAPAARPVPAGRPAPIAQALLPPPALAQPGPIQPADPFGNPVQVGQAPFVGFGLANRVAIQWDFMLMINPEQRMLK